MRLNKRGVALLQVLIISVVLAGISTMILRTVMSRTLAARNTRQTVSSDMVIESCMEEISEFWSQRFEEDPVEAAADLANCSFGIHEISEGVTESKKPECTIRAWGKPVTNILDGTLHVQLTMTGPDAQGRCTIRYVIGGGRRWL